MKIIGTGMTGLVGSRTLELLKDKYQFENISRSSGIDILDKDSLLDLFKSSSASVVIHLAAKANVDDCEKDKEQDLEILKLGVKEQKQEFIRKKTAWGVNVLGTQNITQACRAFNKRLILVSTDFVFDGEKKEPYVEKDLPNPINWYGKTKYEAEKIVENSQIPSTIIRIAYPYRANFKEKDFVRVLINKLRNGEKLRMISDQVITPTFVDDLAQVFDYFISENRSGVYHATGDDSLSPFEIAREVAKVFGFNQDLIGQISGKDFFKGRAKRPFHLALKNDKINRLGIKMKGLEEGLFDIKKQL